MQRISYCKGVIDVNNLSEEAEYVLERLTDGEHAGLHIEKLRGHNLFSCRFNDTDRLLFTYIELNDEQYLLLLDIVRNHAYAKSFATKPRALSKFIELHGDVFQRSIEQMDFESVPEIAVKTKIENINNDNNKPIRKRDYTEMEFFNDQFIALSSDQAKARRVSLPAVIHGAAGSGKSGAAFARITDLAKAMSQEGGERLPAVCYVTQSSALCENMQENFERSPQGELVQQGRICFKTYEQVINSNLIYTGSEQFKEFVAIEINAHRVRCRVKQSSKTKSKPQCVTAKDKPLSEEFYRKIENMYEEMRVISGTETEGEYLELGNNQSLFNRESQQAERCWLYNVYQKYLKYLHKNKMINVGLCPVKVEPQNCIFLVDESQDLAPVQLTTLSRVSQGKVIYYLHEQQSLTDTMGKEHCLNKIIDARNNKCDPIELKSSFRCADTVLAVAQEFLDMGAILAHEAKTSKPASEVKEPGIVRIITQVSEQEEAEMQQEVDSPECVIITDEENIAQARKRFSKGRLVVTIDRFKGLEASTVILYRLLDNEIFAQACEQFSLIAEKKTPSFNKSFGTAFNRAYAACTRVRGAGKLIILQDNPETLRRIQPIMQRLKKHNTNHKINIGAKLTIAEENEIYFERVKELLRTDVSENITLAKRIYMEQLGKTIEDFNKLQTLFVKKKKKPVALSEPKRAETAPTASLTPASISKSKRNKKKKKAEEKKLSVAAVTTVREPLKGRLMSVAEVKDSILKDRMRTESGLPLFREYFTNREYHYDLFSLPNEPTEECRFVEYMSDEFVRQYILTVIMRDHGESLFSLTNFPFDRRVIVPSDDDSTLPPIFWFALKENIWDCLTRTMSTNSLKFSGIVVEASPFSQFRGMSALNLLTRHVAGLKTLHRVVTANLDILVKLPRRFFVTAPASPLANGRSIVDTLLDEPIVSGEVSALSTLLDKIDGLILNITPKHLTAMNEKTKETRLTTLLKTKAGKVFVLALASHNPSIHSLLNPEVLNALAILNDRKLNYVEGLLSNPIDANLSALFSKSKAYEYLFDIPAMNGECLFERLIKDQELKKHLMITYMVPYLEDIFKNAKTNILFNKFLRDGECLFVHLLDHEETRSFMLTHFIPYYKDSLVELVPAHALMRKNQHSGKPDPLIWLCGANTLIQILGRLIDPDEINSLVVNYAFFRPITIAAYKAAGLPADIDIFANNTTRIVAVGDQKTLMPWELLSIHACGTTLLSLWLEPYSYDYFYSHPQFHFSNELKVADHNTPETNPITLLHKLSQSTSGIKFINKFLMVNEKSKTVITTNNLFLEGAVCVETQPGGYIYQGNCALFDLFHNNPEMLTIYFLFTIPYIQLKQSGLLRALFFALTPECIDEKAIARFIVMVNELNLCGMMGDFIQQNDSVVEMFDPALFMSKQASLEGRFAAIESLKKSHVGMLTYRYCQQLIQKSHYSHLQALSLFSNSENKVGTSNLPAPEPDRP